jgi:tetratricopeptide (TPR) repeat protein
VSSQTQSPPPDGLTAGRPASRTRVVAAWSFAAAAVLALGGVWVVHRARAAAGDASIEARPLAAQPPTAAAAAAYRRGMVNMQQQRWAEAVPLFRQAAALDPSFALPWLRLTVALYFLGNSTEVVGAMQQAVRLSAGAPDDVRLRVEPHDFWSQSAWERCAQAARTLRDREPDNFEALLPSLMLTGCVPAPESLAVLARLRASGSPAARDARFDLFEARLAFAEHEDRRAAEALDRVEGKISGPDGRFLEASALVLRSRLAAREGHFDVALQLLTRAENIYAEGLHAFEAARVVGERATVFEAKGEFLPAAAEYERQLTLLEPFGATYAAVLATREGAADYLAAGELRRAAALLERVKSYPERILKSTGGVYASLGRVALEEGDLQRAAAQVEPALERDRNAAEPVLFSAEVAREGLEAATPVVAEDRVQVRIAELLLDVKDTAGAAKVIDQLSADPWAQAQAARLRARSLRQEHRAEAAKAAAEEAVQVARTTRQVPLLQSAQLELARVQMAAASAAGLAVLAELEAQAQQQGAGRLLLEVRLAKLQGLPKGTAERTRQAKTLATDARAAGFLRIARLAQEGS